MKALAILPLLLLAAVAVQDHPEPSELQDEHRWLRQFIGDWTVTMEVIPGPDAEPITMESTETVRAVGDLWILAEGICSFEDGTDFSSVLTLGYDPKQDAFVGTWIDSMTPYLWSYRGTLDDSAEVLTLETEGPRMDDPTRTARYRDVIELKSADHRELRSSIQDEEGNWTTFVRADYRRK